MDSPALKNLYVNLVLDRVKKTRFSVVTVANNSIKWCWQSFYIFQNFFGSSDYMYSGVDLFHFRAGYLSLFPDMMWDIIDHKSPSFLAFYEMQSSYSDFLEFMNGILKNFLIYRDLGCHILLIIEFQLISHDSKERHSFRWIRNWRPLSEQLAAEESYQKSCWRLYADSWKSRSHISVLFLLCKPGFGNYLLSLEVCDLWRTSFVQHVFYPS